MEDKYTEEKRYLEAKKKVKDIKGFYIHFALFILNTPLLIAVNLVTAPYFQWFWFAVLGWGATIGIHAFLVFGDNFLGKDWEKKKIMELMEKSNKEHSDGK